ncbi:MAG: recombinase RecF [Acidobacteria bacterium]|nr:MAG: recombinase RecF [Acidobacteriota bacterium]
MLKRIRIRGFKSLADVTVGGLTPLVVIFGPNAAGKSNFLEALVLLSRLVTERTLGDAFDAPLRGYPAEQFTLPPEGLAGLLGSDHSELSIEADVEPPAAPGKRVHDLRYRVGIRIAPKSGTLSLVDEYLARLRKKDGTPEERPRIERINEHLALRRRQVSGTRQQQFLLDLNHTLASNPQLSGRTYPDFDNLRAELAAWHAYYLDPRVAMRAPQPPREVTDVGTRGEWIAPFLYRLRESERHRRRFDAVGRALRSAIPTIESLDVELDRKRGTLDIEIRQEGTTYSSRVMSEGTLRILALCALAANPWPNTLVAFEEPENGVQPRRIEVIARLLASMADTAGRQVIVTTHSPGLISALARLSWERPELASVYRCIQRGRSTELRRFESLAPILKRIEQLHIDDALRGPEDEARLLAEGLSRGWWDG